MSERSGRLVYSTDPTKVKCPRCGEYTPGCACVKYEEIKDPSKLSAKLRLEKAGRGGKSVSIIFGLPNDKEYLTDLCKRIKNQIGTGGSYKEKENEVEIQGDHRARIKDILVKLGFKVKGA
jgi:translation initiation factor 1